MREMNKRVLIEKKTLGTKEKKKKKKGKYEALDYVRKNLPPYRKKKEKESKRKCGRK